MLRYIYLSKIAFIDADHTLSLNPSTYISKFITDNSSRIQKGIVEVYLVNGINPSITNSNSFHSYLCCSQESLVLYNSRGKGWDIMSCERLTCNIKWRGCKLRPIPIKVIEEILQMLSCASSIRHYLFLSSSITIIGKSDIKWLIDVKGMTEKVPRILEIAGLVLENANRAIFSECSKEGATTRASIEPYYQRYFAI